MGRQVQVLGGDYGRAQVSCGRNWRGKFQLHIRNGRTYHLETDVASVDVLTPGSARTLFGVTQRELRDQDNQGVLFTCTFRDGKRILARADSSTFRLFCDASIASARVTRVSDPPIWAKDTAGPLLSGMTLLVLAALAGIVALTALLFLF